MQGSAAASAGRPEELDATHDYPMPVTIRRTFLEVETAALRSPSLEAFIRERRAHSCPLQDGCRQQARQAWRPLWPSTRGFRDSPATGPWQVQPPVPSEDRSPPTSVSLAGSPKSSEGCPLMAEARHPASGGPREAWPRQDEQVATQDDLLTAPSGAFYLPAGAGMAGAASCSQAPAPATPAARTAASTAASSSSDDDDDGPYGGDSLVGPQDTSDMSPASLLQSLPGSLGPLALGSPAMPTIGSAGHHVRRCKPCAFVLKGCNSGVDCKFCHLCDFGEKKRRKKEKVALRREANKKRNYQGRWNRFSFPAPSTPVGLATLGGHGRD